MVPNGWSEVKLGNVIKHQKGYAFKSKLYQENGLRIVRISDTNRNSVHDKCPVYIEPENTKGLDSYILQEEDIILSTVGSRPHLLESMVGKAVKIPKKDSGSFLNQNLVKVIPKKGVITNDYLFSMLKNDTFNYFISTLVRGNANQVSITLAELFAYRFLLPSHPEQTKIAQILSTWDKAIATVEKLIENSKQQKKALMQQLLTGKKRFKEFGEPAKDGELPDGWASEKLVDITSWSSGGTPSKQNKTYWDGHIPWISASTMRGHAFDTSDLFISEEGLKVGSRLAPKDGLLLLVRGSMLWNKIPVGIAKRDLAFNQDLKCIRAKDSINPHYLLTWFLCNENKLMHMVTGTGIGAGKLDTSELQALDIALPPKQEQLRIIELISSLDASESGHKKNLDCLNLEKKALMQQLLTGKRRVKVNANEAMSA